MGEAIDISDPAAVWANLVDQIGQRSLAWLRFLEIDRVERDRIVLRVVPGHRDVIGFCTEQRLDQIGQHLSPILGRRVRVTVQPPDGPQATTEQATEAGDGSGGARPSRLAADRRDAMNLPLVQRVLENFPDATLIDARDEAGVAPPQPPADDADAEPADPAAPVEPGPESAVDSS